MAERHRQRRERQICGFNCRFRRPAGGHHGTSARQVRDEGRQSRALGIKGRAIRNKEVVVQKSYWVEGVAKTHEEASGGLLMDWARHSPPDMGGVDATSRRSREASFDGADGREARAR